VPEPQHPSALLQAPVAAAIDHEPAPKDQPTRRFCWSWPCPCVAGPAWDRDRQTRSDQRVSTMKRRAGATTTGKKCPTGTTLDTLGNRLRPDVPLQSTIAPRRRKSAETGYGHPCSMGKKRLCPAYPGLPRAPARAPGRRAERGSAVRRRPPLHGQASIPTGGRSATLDARCPDRRGARDAPTPGTRPRHGKPAADLMEGWLGLLPTPSGPTKPAPSTTSGPAHPRRSISGGGSGGRWPGTAARRSPTAA
jgi:hypothetical protein